MAKRTLLPVSLIVAMFFLFISLANAQITFQKSYGAGFFDMFPKVQQTSDDGFILTSSSMNLLSFTGSMVKTLPDGTVSWAHSIDGVEFQLAPPFGPWLIDDANYMINDVKQTTDGGYIITGEISPSPLGVYGEVTYDDCFLIKTDASGNISWSQRYGGSEMDVGSFVKQASDGGYLVTGYTHSFSAKDSANVFIFKTNSSGGLSWNQTVEVSTVDGDYGVAAEELTDGYVIAGYSEQVNGTDTLSDILLIKTDKATGTISWIKTYGDNGDDEQAADIKVSTSGELLVTGYTDAVGSGLPNTLLMKVNAADGSVNAVTSHYLDGFNGILNEGHSIQQTADGGIAIIGFAWFVLSGPQSFVLKTDYAGTTVDFAMAYQNSFIGMQLFATGMQTSDDGFIIGTMMPGGAGWAMGLIKTDDVGNSGCYQSAPTPGQEACSYTPVTPAYSTFSGATANSIAAVFSNLSITPTTECCTPLPNDAGTISGPTTVCQGDNGVAYTVPAIPGAIDYTWTVPSGAGVASGAGTNSITVNYSGSAASGNVSVFGTNDCGPGNPYSLYVTVETLPDAAGTISGQATVCQSETGITYTVPAIAGATSYVWGLPSGATGSSTTNSITVDYGAGATSGNITVYGTNSCGSGTQSTYPITVATLPAAAGSISGNATVCQSDNSVAYSVPAISGATSYTWSVSNGATGSSTTENISIDFTAASSPVEITVYGSNSCGDGTVSSVYSVTINDVPLAPGAITGEDTVCQGETAVAYSVPPITDATGYEWTLPSGGSIATGTNTESITVDFSAGTASGDVVVYGTNSCGNGPSVSFPVLVISLPADADTIMGADTVCQGDTGIVYAVPDIAGATEYVWTIPSGSSFSGDSTTSAIVVNYSDSASSGDITVYGTNQCGIGNSFTLAIQIDALPDDAGQITGNDTVCQGDSGIVYTISSINGATSYTWSVNNGASGSSTTENISINFTAASSPVEITVYGSNSCGDGTVSNVYSVTVNDVPFAPGLIAGEDTVCQGETNVVYSVPPITDATGYEWALPSGGSIASGINTESIAVDYSAGAVSGDVVVYGTNSCGDGPSETFPVVLISTPADADTILGADTVCQGDTAIVYTVPDIAGATDYVWTIPSGSSFSSDSTTSSIVVNYSDSASSGNITVYGSNQCGIGNSFTLAIQIDALPDDAGPITGNDTVCQGDSGIVYSISAINGATSYIWSLPIGSSIVDGLNSTTLTVEFSDSAQSGNIMVYGSNKCGDGVPSYIAINVDSVPMLPGSIIGNDTVCQGDSGIVYSVPLISDADSYFWVVPSGVTILSGAGTDSIIVQFADTAAAGTIIVNGINDCGNGPVSTFNVAINDIPSNADTIVGQDTVCQGETGVIYSVPFITNAEYYNWTVPSGASIVVDSDSIITVNFADTAVSGFVTVYGSSYCGTGAMSDSFAVHVNLLPYAAGPITGPTAICEGSDSVIFSIPLISNASAGYAWTVPTGASIIGAANTNSILVDFPSGSVSGDVTVQGLNDCGSGQPASYSITINPYPSAAISGDMELCQKELTVLTASGGGEFLWSTGGTNASIGYTALSNDSIPVTDTVYVVVTEVSTGCSDSAFAIITINPLPLAYAGEDTLVCEGDPINLNASGGSGFSWTPVTGLNNPDIANPIATPSATTTYAVEVFNSYACSTSDSVVVTVNPMPGFTVSQTENNCYGDNSAMAYVTITSGNPPYSYYWDNGSINDTITNLATGLYAIIITDVYGCQNGTVVNIQEPDQLILSVSGTDETCFGRNDGTASVVVSGGTAPYSYTWSDSLTTTASLVSGLFPGVLYEVVVMDANFCYSRDSVMIGSPDQIEVEAVSYTNVSCYGQSDGSISVASSGGSGDHTYLWSDPDQQTGDNAISLSAGTYEVTVVDSVDCAAVMSVEINQPEGIFITAETDSTSCIDAEDGSIILTIAGGRPPYYYEWGDFSSQESYLENLRADSYYVTVTDSNNCSSYDTIDVYLSENACLIVPVVFTPNDDGYNETWEIVGIEFYPAVKVQIYNRWGDLMFESKGYPEQWDGKSRKGKKLPVGPYMYIVDLYDDGTEVLTGVVTIVK